MFNWKVNFSQAFKKVFQDLKSQSTYKCVLDDSLFFWFPNRYTILKSVIIAKKCADQMFKCLK